MKRYLVLDVNYLCYRAFFSTGHLEFNGDSTGVLFGVFKTVEDLKSKFSTDRVVWCFDHGKGLREQKYPWYKSDRRKRKMTDEQAVAIEGLRSQVEKLKMEYLERVGYKNVFFQKGYEADDIIASFCNRLNEEAIIISGDEDLYQIIRHPYIEVYHPRTQERINLRAFKNKYSIWPNSWPLVKAIAGCTSDSIPGCPGIGEKKAIQYMTGKMLPKTHAAHDKILKYSNSKDYDEALELVTLPYPGCKQFKPKKDAFNSTEWNKLLKDLGINSMRTGTDTLYGD